jgi:hypothetical protein
MEFASDIRRAPSAIATCLAAIDRTIDKEIARVHGNGTNWNADEMTERVRFRLRKIERTVLVACIPTRVRFRREYGGRAG